MKKLTFILMVAILLAGAAAAAMSTPSYAQGYVYAPAPADPYSQPWVGPNTPWVYYNGDWFLNGILYYYYGPRYGWAPYYAYAPTYIVRPGDWYASRWLAWYQGNPQYYQQFQQAYPYWQGHREGQRYDQNFYEQHHSGQGAGWQKGFQGRPAAPAQPQGQRPGPAQVAPRRNRDRLLLKRPRVRNRDRLLPAWRPPGRDRLLLKRPRVRNRDRLLLAWRRRDPPLRLRDRLLLKRPPQEQRQAPAQKAPERVNLKRKNISRPRRKGETPSKVRAVALFRAAGNAPQIAPLRRLT